MYDTVVLHVSVKRSTLMLCLVSHVCIMFGMGRGAMYYSGARSYGMCVDGLVLSVYMRASVYI
jgi:hypothetical protein